VLLYSNKVILMNIKYIALVIFPFLVFACSNNEKFPELISEKIPVETLTINESFQMKKPLQTDSVIEFISDDLPDELIKMKDLYELKDDYFDLQKMELFWNDVRNMNGVLSKSGIKNWISATGFLFEITAKEIYAAELERIQYEPNYESGDGVQDDLALLLEPYIFTRNTDFFHINLFANASFEFEHSLFGKIKITQETKYPNSGDVILTINTEKKRYMEIFVRIPDWADGATVTVNNVKFFAPTGDYCQIAKNWENGDMAEIHFPEEKMPAYLKNY